MQISLREKSQVRRYTRSKFGNFIIFFCLVLAGLFMLLPMIYTIISSFKPLEEILVYPPKFFVKRPTLINYLSLPSLLSNLMVPFSRYLFNSTFIAVCATFLHVIVASGAAYVFTMYKRFKTITLCFVIVQFSLLFNAYTLAVPQYFIFAKLNMLNTYFVYILPAIPSALGVFLMKQFMEGSIPHSVIEAARIDGAGTIRIFGIIVMPMVKPAWMTLVLLTFSSTWSMSSSNMVFSEQIKLLPNIMSQIASGGLARMGASMASSVLMMLPPMIIYLFSQSNIIETMASSGMKE